MRKLIALILSLTTIVGGHLLNRRSDKALLFFSLLLVFSSLIFFIYPALSFTGRNFPFLNGIHYSQLLSVIILSGLALIAILSAIVSYLDARHPPQDSGVTFSGMVGGLLSAVIVWTVVIYMGVYASINLHISKKFGQTDIQAMTEGQPATKSDRRRAGVFVGSDNHFWHNVRYGFKWIPDEELSPLPSGDAYLSGRINYDGAPAVGVTLTGIFNGQFISDEITTDADGRFTFRLPEGEWRLNRIKTTSWSNKPADRSFSVVGSASPALSDDYYHNGPEYESDGQLLTTQTEPHIDASLEITIRDNITIDWPNQESMPSDLTGDSISWQPVAGASSYQVQLQQIEKEGSTTTYYPVYWKNTESTNLPLEQIRSTRATGGSTKEYQVVINAFDKDGRFLTSSPEHRPLYSFEIQGREIPSFQTFPSLKSDATSVTEEDIEQMQEEKKMIDAAMFLARSDMPAAARELIAKRSSNHLEERSDTLEGLILTAEGRCQEARQHFESINLKWDRHCLPDFFQQRCPSP